MKLIKMVGLTFCVVVNLLAFEKKTYCFSHEPIDVVIVCHEKDLRTLEMVIEGVKQNISHRNIFVVSAQSLTDQAIWFDEAQFPFSKKTIALEMFGNEDDAQRFIDKPGSRIGWIFQQFCKMYSVFAIPEISENVLIIDADTIFLRPIAFQAKDGAPLFNTGREYNKPYFDHMARVIPELKKIYPKISGITHHMLFQRCVMEDLFTMIRAHNNNAEPWKALSRAINPDDWSGISEYEMYFNFYCSRTDQIHLRSLAWDNMSLKRFVASGAADKDYVSCHSFIRG